MSDLRFGAPELSRAPKSFGGSVWFALIFALLAVSTIVLSSRAAAAAPPVGAIIGNQASASYTDGNNVPQTTTSNLVETTVTQVAGVTVVPDNNRQAAPGSTVYLPHTITNTGNGNDQYNLTKALINTPNDIFVAANVVIYADADGNGVPDNFTPLTQTPILAPGESYQVVIAAQVKPTATSGQSSQINIVATSQHTGTVTDNATDTVTVTLNAVVPVLKSLNIQSGPASTVSLDTIVDVTLAYENTGGQTAVNLALTDLLDARYEYIDGSARWSVSGLGVADPALDEDAGGDPVGINYAVTGNTVSATVASIAPGQSGRVVFKVKVKVGTVPGVIPNTVGVVYGDGAGNNVTTTTNDAPFTVTPVPGVLFTDAGSSTDDDGETNDIVVAPSATQGGTIDFHNVLTNTGNVTDTFDITLVGSNFPAGTHFELLNGTSSTPGNPLTNSNANSIVDTGPLAPGATFHVWLRVTLPPGVVGGPYQVTKVATSAVHGVTDSVVDRLTAITANSVDLTNNAALPTGDGAGVTASGEVAAVTTNNVAPGGTTTFDLFVNNTSSIADSYDLLASAVGSDFSAGLPVGWTVTFRKFGTTTVITNTGTIAAGDSVRVTATVVVPANAAPGLTSIFFRARSPTSDAADVKHDAVNVASVIDLAVTPNNTSQGAAGGQVVYKHTLSNNGNVAVAAAPLTSVESSTDPWSSVIWFDADGNGLIEGSNGDVVVDNLDDIIAAIVASPALYGSLLVDDGGVFKLKPGAQLPLLVQVFVPSGAPAFSSNTTTVTIAAVGDANLSNNVATDLTTVVGDVQVRKTQAVDAACDGTADGAFVATGLTAKPGECLIYEIKLTNLSAATVTGVTISDATPNHTTFWADGGASDPTVSPLGTVNTPLPTVGLAGTVSASVPTVSSTASTTLRFSVKIND